MEKRMGVLEEVTRAFWSAAPSDEDIAAATNNRAPSGEVQAMERWRDAKQAALQTMQDYQKNQLEDVEGADQHARLQELLAKAWVSRVGEGRGEHLRRREGYES